MTLIKVGDIDATTLLIDVNIWQEADSPEGESRDIAKDLRGRLKKDENGRSYGLRQDSRVRWIAGK